MPGQVGNRSLRAGSVPQTCGPAAALSAQLAAREHPLLGPRVTRRYVSRAVRNSKTGRDAGGREADASDSFVVYALALVFVSYWLHPRSWLNAEINYLVGWPWIWMPFLVRYRARAVPVLLASGFFTIPAAMAVDATRTAYADYRSGAALIADEGPNRGNLHREYRAPTRGPVVTTCSGNWSYGPRRNLSYQPALGAILRVLGPARGAYLGEYPTIPEAVQALRDAGRRLDHQAALETLREIDRVVACRRPDCRTLVDEEIVRGFDVGGRGLNVFAADVGACRLIYSGSGLSAGSSFRAAGDSLRFSGLSSAIGREHGVLFMIDRETGAPFAFYVQRSPSTEQGNASASPEAATQGFLR